MSEKKKKNVQVPILSTQARVVLGVLALVVCGGVMGFMFMLDDMFGSRLQDPDLCCDGTLACGTRFDFEDSDHYMITRHGFATHAYFCYADGSAAAAYREGEDTRVYIDDGRGQVAIHDWWDKEIRYYAPDTFDLVERVTCNDNACTDIQAP